MMNGTLHRTMLLLMAALLVITLLSACGGSSRTQNNAGDPGNSQSDGQRNSANGSANGNMGSDGQAESQDDDKLDSETEAAVMLDFQLLVREANDAAELVAYIDEHIAAVSRTNAEIMIRGLKDYYSRTLYRTQDRFSETSFQMALHELEWPVTIESAEQLQDEQWKRMLTRAFEGGYKLTAAEGDIYPIVDYAAFQRFRPYISAGLAEYIELLAMESSVSSVSDAAIVVSWDELGRRLLQVERYLKEHVEADDFEDAKGLYMRYLSVYLIGVDNTPSYDFLTGKLLAEVKQSYQELIRANPDTMTAELLEDYLAILTSNHDNLFADPSSAAFIAELEQFFDGLTITVNSLLY